MTPPLIEPVARPRDLLAGLRAPGPVRARCAAITQAVSDGRSGHFRIDRSALPALASRIAERAAASPGAPGLALGVPVLSFWHDLSAGGADRLGELDSRLAGRPAQERVSALFDLATLGALLAADAGNGWSFRDEAGAIGALALPAQQHGRDALLDMLDRAAGSPKAAGAADPPPQAATPAPASGAPPLAGTGGLAAATLRAFMAGAFSTSVSDPLRADAAALKLVDPVAVRAIFQVSGSNPLVGVDGRAALLVRLGEAVQAESARYGGAARPALLLDRLTDDGARSELSAAELLQTLLRVLGPVWRGAGMVKGVPAGDVWPHPFAGAAGADAATAGVVPFHHGGQWLARSLVGPLQQSGVAVTSPLALTGLSDHAAGGVLIGAGVIVPRRERALSRRWPVGSEFIVEWRALTVTLLDELAAAAGLPLDAVMAACRQLPALTTPPAIDGDGSLF